MTTPPNFADVEALLAERDAVAGWLAKLDDAGSAVPAAVRERVRLDYQLRLDGVTHKLQGHGDQVAARLAEDRAERDAHAASAAAARDALAEAELRHLVGEYDARRVADERTRHGADIERHERALGLAAERVRGLEEILSQITAPAMARAVAETADDTEAVPETPIDEPLDDEIDEQLLSIFDEGETETIAELEVDLVEEFDEPPVTERRDDDRGPLSFRPGSGMPPEADRVIPSFGMPAEIPARFTPAEESPRPAPTPINTPTPTPTPSRPTLVEEEIVASGPPPEPMTISAGRTLRCAECGAMNKSSEWYCEKCGAELNVG